MPSPCRIQTSGPLPAPVNVGDMARFRAVVSDYSNSLVDPGELVFRWKVNADGAVTAYTYLGPPPDDANSPELVRVDIGVYHVDLPFDSAGVVYARWEASGDYQGAVELDQAVYETQFTS